MVFSTIALWYRAAVGAAVKAAKPVAVIRVSVAIRAAGQPQYGNGGNE
jgi:hypothetical protein